MLRMAENGAGELDVMLSHPHDRLNLTEFDILQENIFNNMQFYYTSRFLTECHFGVNLFDYYYYTKLFVERFFQKDIEFF
jgi:hypothetical protein